MNLRMGYDFLLLNQDSCFQKTKVVLNRIVLEKYCVAWWCGRGLSKALSVLKQFHFSGDNQFVT